jgi:hypothetical protein
MGDRLASIRLPKTIFNLGEKTEALDGILDRCVVRQWLEGLQDFFFWDGHAHEGFLGQIA